MKQSKRFVLCLLCLTIVLHMIPHTNASRPTSTGHEYHFVVIYDVSTSMGVADSSKQIRDMIALLLDKIRSDMFPIKVAVLPFAGACPAVTTMQNDKQSWWELESYKDTRMSDLKGKLKELEYTSIYTDIGGALQAGNDILSKMSKGVDSCTQTVLFITDGFPYLNSDPNSDTGKIDFEKTYGNLETIKAAAESFPDNAHFLGIVPDDSSRGNHLKYNDDDTKITEYYGIDVPERYGEQMVEVPKCMDRFCDALRNKQPEGQTNIVKLYKVEWDSEAINAIDKIYMDFCEQIFSASITEITHQDMSDAVVFTIPEAVSEVNITIIPDAKTLSARKKAVERCSATVSCGDMVYDDCVVPDSINEVTVRLVDPIAGEHTLLCEGITFATLRFCTYGALQIVPDQKDLKGVAGEQMSISGRIVNGAQQQLSSDFQQFVKFSADGLDRFDEVVVDESLDAQGRWNVSFTPTEAGKYEITLTIDYDDTNHSNMPRGISHFYTSETVQVTIESPPPSPTPTPTPTPSPPIPDRVDPISVKTFTAGCIAAALLVGVFCIISHFRNRHGLRATEPDGTTSTIYVQRRDNKINVVVRTKIPGLRVRYLGGDEWEYIYNQGPPRRVINDEIDLR